MGLRPYTETILGVEMRAHLRPIILTSRNLKGGDKKAILEDFASTLSHDLCVS